jgi:hypothetical protein
VSSRLVHRPRPCVAQEHVSIQIGAVLTSLTTCPGGGPEQRLNGGTRLTSFPRLCAAGTRRDSSLFGFTDECLSLTRSRVWDAACPSPTWLPWVARCRTHNAEIEYVARVKETSLLSYHNAAQPVLAPRRRTRYGLMGSTADGRGSSSAPHAAPACRYVSGRWMMASREVCASGGWWSS